MKTVLRSNELSCPSCIVKIEKALHAQAGVDEAKVFFNTGRIEVDHDPEVISAKEVATVVDKLGYLVSIAAF
jgi:copper chaperone